MRRGLELRRAGVRVHLLGQTGGAGTDRARRKRARGGGRSSGTDGLGATARFEANWWGLRLPEEALSTPTCSGATCGCCNRGGDMAGGGERSAPVVDAARGRIRQRGMGETMQRLTAVLLVLLARQGRHGVRRNDGGDHRRPRSRSAALEMQQSFWRRVTRWRGRRRRGGARGYVGEARGRLWVRQRRAVATSSARLSRERDKGGDEHGGRSERARGGAWRRPEGSGRPTKQEVAKRVGARGGHTPSCPLARGGRRQAGSWAGPACWAASWAA